MHLVMFDIDGTLTETMKADEECFVRSFKDVFGFVEIDTDWSHYPISLRFHSRNWKCTTSIFQRR
jgi:beta-phosphoglucomutase-like phosphatase (HAD superfamily)